MWTTFSCCYHKRKWLINSHNFVGEGGGAIHTFLLFIEITKLNHSDVYTSQFEKKIISRFSFLLFPTLDRHSITRRNEFEDTWCFYLIWEIFCVWNSGIYLQELYSFSCVSNKSKFIKCVALLYDSYILWLCTCRWNVCAPYSCPTLHSKYLLLCLS